MSVWDMLEFQFCLPSTDVCFKGVFPNVKKICFIEYKGPQCSFVVITQIALKISAWTILDSTFSPFIPKM